jgi:hypothetical protein
MTDLDDALGQQFDDVAFATALWLNGSPRVAVQAVADRCAARHRDDPADTLLTACAAVVAATVCCAGDDPTPGGPRLLEHARRVLVLAIEQSGVV